MGSELGFWGVCPFPLLGPGLGGLKLEGTAHPQALGADPFYAGAHQGTDPREKPEVETQRSPRRI